LFFVSSLIAHYSYDQADQVRTLLIGVAAWANDEAGGLEGADLLHGLGDGEDLIDAMHVVIGALDLTLDADSFDKIVSI
jgi:hypothetical protein